MNICWPLPRFKISGARGAADSIKSRTPAEMLGRGPRPGVERSGTPGKRTLGMSEARGAADSRINMIHVSQPLSAASRAQRSVVVLDPGVSLRSTPGFMLLPATRVLKSHIRMT